MPPRPLLAIALIVEAAYHLTPDFGFGRENVLAQTLLMSFSAGAILEVQPWMWWVVAAVKVSAIVALWARRVAGRWLFLAYIVASIFLAAIGGLLVTSPSVAVVGMLLGLLDGAIVYAILVDRRESPRLS